MYSPDSTAAPTAKKTSRSVPRNSQVTVGLSMGPPRDGRVPAFASVILGGETTCSGGTTRMSARGRLGRLARPRPSAACAASAREERGAGDGGVRRQQREVEAPYQRGAQRLVGGERGGDRPPVCRTSASGARTRPSVPSLPAPGVRWARTTPGSAATAARSASRTAGSSSGSARPGPSEAARSAGPVSSYVTGPARSISSVSACLVRQRLQRLRAAVRRPGRASGRQRASARWR